VLDFGLGAAGVLRRGRDRRGFGRVQPRLSGVGLVENRRMAFGSLLLLLDDIASVLDDVALLTKTAAAKTAGVVGDDLALNAQQLGGLAAEREWPVVWAVARGSLVNKAILVPAALALSAWAPALVAPLLMVGGVYLCLEGVEKLVHRRPASDDDVLEHPPAPAPAPDAAMPATAVAAVEARLASDLAALEQERIRGAIRTDLILSAEIIVIALGSVAGAPLPARVLALVSVALLMTLGVYGFVAAIVKVDDLGLWLAGRGQPLPRRIGVALLQAAPWMMKLLTWVGTAAMFFVGGGILVHGIPPLHDALAQATATPGSALGSLLVALAGALVGVFAGGVALAASNLLRRLRAPR
jgi:uncharacterized protein